MNRYGTPIDIDGLPQELIHRRTFLRTSTAGIGTAVLASFLKPGLLGGAGLLHAADGKPAIDKWTGVVNPLHHPAKVKRIIYLCMAGGPSHLETWDYKPKLAEMHGQPMPESFTKGKPIAQLQGAKLNCFGPQHKFQRVPARNLLRLPSRAASDLFVERSFIPSPSNPPCSVAVFDIDFKYSVLPRKADAFVSGHRIEITIRSCNLSESDHALILGEYKQTFPVI